MTHWVSTKTGNKFKIGLSKLRTLRKRKMPESNTLVKLTIYANM